jgi:hypothetical protein
LSEAENMYRSDEVGGGIMKFFCDDRIDGRIPQCNHTHN